ncbi:MAG: ATP-dependent DNA helicase RecQ, partial [Spirochaetaceae bacterium]
ELFHHLRAVRLGIAREKGLPPYVVFSDRTLREMARHRPVSTAGLLRIHGVGDTKAERYGHLFLAAIGEFPSPE